MAASPKDSQGSAARKGAAAPRSRTPLLSGVILALASGLLALGLGEAALRIFFPEPLSLRFEQVIQRGEAKGHVELVHEIIEYDPVLFWRLKRNLTLPKTSQFFPGVVSNDQGLRETKTVSREKPAGEIRILFVGDSCTFGWGVTLEESIPSFVETSLRERYPRVPIECINAGVPAYSLFQGYMFLETQGYALQPDLVVVNFGTNDMVAWSEQTDLENHRERVASQPPRGLAWSRVCQRLWRVLHSRAATSPRESHPAESPDAAAGSPAPSKKEVTEADRRPPRVPADEFAYLLGQIQKQTRVRNMELLLVTWPHDWNLEPPGERRTSHQQVIEVFSKLRMSFGPLGAPGHVDLVPVVQELGRELPASAIFKDPLHVTVAANRRFANALVERISPWLEARGEVAGGGSHAVPDAPLLTDEGGSSRAPELLDLPRPDLSRFEPAAREKLGSGLAALEKQVASEAQGAPLANAFGEQGMLCHAHDLWDAAEACYLNASRLAPDDSGWPHLLGLVYAQQARMDESAQQLERALELNPISAATVVALGEVHAARGRPDLAEPLLLGAANIPTTRARALLALGSLALARRDYAAALRHLEAARDLVPQATVVNEPMGLALQGLGDLERGQELIGKRGDVAVPAGDRLLATVHDLANDAQAHLQRALEAAAKGAFDVALAEFRLAVEAEPESAPARVGLGSLLGQAGNYAGAREQFEAVLRLDADHPAANCNIGRLLARDGDDVGAIRHCEAGLAAGSEPTGCRLILANALHRLGRDADAEPHFARLVASKPEDAAGHHGLAMVRVRLGRWQAARAAVEAGLAVTPGQRLLRQDLVRLLAACPDATVRDAARAVTEAQALFQEESSYLHVEALAMALANAGRFAEAAKYQQAAIDAVRRSSREDLVPRLAPNLALYQSGQPCRRPWPEGE